MIKLRKKHLVVALCLLAVVIAGVTSKRVIAKKKDVIDINIGYQSITSQTWGALIIKNQHLYEKKLESILPNEKVNVQWHDELSGSAINNNMLVHKYQIGYMGDMPCVINLFNSYSNSDYDSYLLQMDGKGIGGKNQAIMVSKDSNIMSVEELAGKKISVPVGSSAHRMLLDILNNKGIVHDVTIVHQDIPTAIGMLETGKVDAIAVWEPYETSLFASGKAKVLVEGAETKQDYLAGIMVDRKIEEEHPELIEAYKQAVDEAHEFIINNPDKSALIISEESGFDIDVVKKVIGNITWDSILTKDNVKTLSDDYSFLRSIDSVEEYPFEEELKKREK